MSSQPVNPFQNQRFNPQSAEDRSPAQTHHGQTPEEKAEESRRIHQLQSVLDRVQRVIQSDRNLPVERASALVADARRAALAMFPEKAAAFDMLWWPRLQRTMRERYRMQ